MIATLSDACERDSGSSLRDSSECSRRRSNRKWKRTCCVPSFLLVLLVLLCMLGALVVLGGGAGGGGGPLEGAGPEGAGPLQAVLVSLGSLVGVALLLNIRTWWQLLDSLLHSQRKRLHRAANRMSRLKSEGLHEGAEDGGGADGHDGEDDDGFSQHQTRLTVVIDGLDSCEQDKVLQMLDTVRVLFSKGPFISIFASDPHIIIKAINQNLNSVLRDSNINGHDYMRNIVHLPVFLNSRGLSSARKMRQVQRSVTRQMSFDLTKLMVTEDWFNDISPQTMRRLLNIVSVTGRLLRANQITFNWDRLASWINLTEQWPYRTSWIILYLEESDGRVYDVMTWAATQICICYMVVPFILLSVGPSLKFYRRSSSRQHGHHHLHQDDHAGHPEPVQLRGGREPAGAEGSLEIVQELIRRGANVNLDDVDCWSALISAAKEGHLEVVKELLENSAYIEHRDMGGWTALMWAAYKGQVDVTELLLENGANPNTTGQQYSVYPIIWAAGRGHADIVKVLLETGAKVNCSDKYGTTPLIWASRKGHFDCRNPNVNMTDKDGNTALMIAAKEGFTEIVQDLLDAGTYVNIPDRSGDTVLIGAVRGGHVEIVRALLHKYADIDIRGQRGDTPLHIAIRGRSRRLAELLLRNPKDGRLLYRPNKGGETPYNIDCSHQKSILTQIFGARHLSPTETDGDMLGHPERTTMQPPICVGLYAQWGSGKSFLLKKLEDEMKTFAGQQIDPLFSFSWLVVFLSLMFCSSVALVLGFTVDPKLALAVSLSLLALLYLFFGRQLDLGLAAQHQAGPAAGIPAVLLRLMFRNPPSLPEQSTRALPVRFLFTDYNRLSSVGGETSMAEMIATLSDACEREFGFLATRLFRVFKTEESQGNRKWKRTCCVPSFLLVLLVLLCMLGALVVLVVVRGAGPEGAGPLQAVLVSLGSLVGVALLLNIRTWWQLLDSLLHSQRKRLHRAANRMSRLKSEGFMKVSTPPLHHLHHLRHVHHHHQAAPSGQ
ncbi:hypothetical protein F7725_028370 [Dissostichus mawsoni]|uniref:KAP NTPase domain-containing protein n=1 Tax=Dissostichus mawsoni TaxID=36200 RepID=A0A7J5XFI2_DISMA|nr:hypothetical protein F7725_028370 [Dissostichus mawsoni]